MTTSQDDADLPFRGPLEFVRVDADRWNVTDHGFPHDDTRHILARVHEDDHGLDVTWMSPRVPLPTRYRDAEDILDDLTRWRERPRRATRPLDIASHRPRRAR